MAPDISTLTLRVRPADLLAALAAVNLLPEPPDGRPWALDNAEMCGGFLLVDLEPGDEMEPQPGHGAHGIDLKRGVVGVGQFVAGETIEPSDEVAPQPTPPTPDQPADGEVLKDAFVDALRRLDAEDADDDEPDIVDLAATSLGDHLPKLLAASACAVLLDYLERAVGPRVDSETPADSDDEMIGPVLPVDSGRRCYACRAPAVWSRRVGEDLHFVCGVHRLLLRVPGEGDFKRDDNLRGRSCGVCGDPAEWSAATDTGAVYGCSKHIAAVMVGHAKRKRPGDHPPPRPTTTEAG